jgi:hypothetical protein
MDEMGGIVLDLLDRATENFLKADNIYPEWSEDKKQKFVEVEQCLHDALNYFNVETGETISPKVITERMKRYRAIPTKYRIV